MKRHMSAIQKCSLLPGQLNLRAGNKLLISGRTGAHNRGMLELSG